jgi:hypothetical protein
VQLVAALFVDTVDFHERPGPATAIDLRGVYFSIAAPGPFPLTLEPHLSALIYCPATEDGRGVFEVVFRRGDEADSEEVARNVSPFSVEPGKFTSRLVRASLTFDGPGRVVAHCRIGLGPVTLVPLTVLG